eukprot:scaffold41942_cov72-Cyclotella_meneghiniana.AAC.16
MPRRLSTPSSVHYEKRRRSSKLLYTKDSDNNPDEIESIDQILDDDGFMDLDEADELFFNSMIRKDDHELGGMDPENPDDLMKLLQEMIDSNNAGAIDDEDYAEMDEETLMEILGYANEDEVEAPKASGPPERSDSLNNMKVKVPKQVSVRYTNDKGMRDLEHALMQGVVPADAGVGSGMLPGDIGFDPLGLSTKDYFKQVQIFLLNMLPERKNRIDDRSELEEHAKEATTSTQRLDDEEDRPPALILRDYREAEIRHGRLAMLAAAVWPIQEIVDRILIPDSFGDFTVVYGGTTLPFLPLLMTFMMLNLGYLDIYSSEIKEEESGDAFLPGECFWDPLCMLEGAPDQMKWNMQEREILNGRAAMIAVAAFAFEESMTHVPVISIGRNDLLFEPVYQVPFIQAWLDQQFASVGDTIMIQ